ncbi:MAG: hypothetical protein M3R25_08615 [Bacteroidota bacterium]|nr:hypothetical protein [Bacteroidota bacterium]
MLEKIEELTLYMILLNEEMNVLKEENNKLKEMYADIPIQIHTEVIKP